MGNVLLQTNCCKLNLTVSAIQIVTATFEGFTHSLHLSLFRAPAAALTRNSHISSFLFPCKIDLEVRYYLSHSDKSVQMNVLLVLHYLCSSTFVFDFVLQSHLFFRLIKQ